VDANGTRFHLLLGEDDWASCQDAATPAVGLDVHFKRAPAACDGDTAGFAWDNTAGTLTLRPCLVQFKAPPNDTPPDPNSRGRRGAARDPFGNIYWIAESATELLVVPSATGVAVHFWSPGDGLTCDSQPHYGEFHPAADPSAPASLQLAGLAVTDDHYLVVGVVEPAGFLLFDLHAGGPPQQFTWPLRAPQKFVPFDIAPRPGGGVWVLDRAGHRYYALDRNFAPDPVGQPLTTIDPGARDDFQPLEPSPVRRTAASLFTPGVSIDASDPTAIESLPDGSVLILDRMAGRPARLLRDGIGQRFGDPLPLEPFDVDAYDLVFVPAAPGAVIKGRLFVASAEGNQAFAYDMSTTDDGRVTFTLAAEYFPMRLFGGKGLISSSSQAFYDFADGWVPLMAQRRPRYAASAALRTRVFDGGEPACVWHRLMIDACVPVDAALHVRSRAADDEALVPLARWQPEPDPYLRRDGSELPLVAEPDAERSGTWELLFQRARGRYLQIELTLSGNSRVSPRVRALRAYYPRFSYLQRYLPAVYREDETSASFLDRFLANIEGFYTTIEDRIAAVQALFDVRSAPADTLDWLASWFGVALDPAWNEQTQRLFIRYAPDFFSQRGTIQGLQNAIRLAIDGCLDPASFTPSPPRTRGLDQVRIVETWRTRQVPPLVAGDSTETIGPREVPAAVRWRPMLGRTRLNSSYRAFLASRAIDVPANAEFPVQEPDDADAARVWRDFAQQALGFVPSATAADADAWQAFLARRYNAAGALARVYNVASPEEVPLPDGVPPDRHPLQDWFDFESTVMAVRRTAHRFLVLLPVPRSVDNTDEFRRDRIDLVRRVVELEKPAHTVFDVKFYWALFRVGAERLGDDTLVDRGGRAPDLLPPLRLGHGYLAESLLAAGHPQNVAERRILGRDTLDGQPAIEETRA